MNFYLFYTFLFYCFLLHNCYWCFRFHFCFDLIFIRWFYYSLWLFFIQYWWINRTWTWYLIFWSFCGILDWIFKLTNFHTFLFLFLIILNLKIDIDDKIFILFRNIRFFFEISWSHIVPCLTMGSLRPRYTIINFRLYFLHISSTSIGSIPLPTLGYIIHLITIIEEIFGMTKNKLLLIDISLYERIYLYVFICTRLHRVV